MARLCMPENESSTATLETPAANANAGSAREDAAAAAVLAAQESGRVAPEKMAEVRAQVKTATAAESRDDRGRFAGKEDKAEAKTDDKAKIETPKSEPAQARKAREDDALARHALKRDGFTDEEIDAMPQASRVLVGLKTKERLDAMARQHAQKSNQPDPRSMKAEEGAGEGRGRTAKPDPSAMLNATLPEPEADGPQTEGLERVLDALDDDLKETLQRAIETDRTTSAKELRALRKEAAQIKQEIFATRLKVAQSTLEREFPALADDSRAAEVGKFMKRLEPNTDFTSMSGDQIHALMTEACAAVFGREIAQAARDRHVQALSDDLAGQPYTGGTKGSDSPRKVSKEDIAAEVALKYPGDMDAARRELNRRMGV